MPYNPGKTIKFLCIIIYADSDEFRLSMTSGTFCGFVRVCYLGLKLSVVGWGSKILGWS